MADPFLAEIRIFPYTFPPKGWAFCDGQLMPISQNTALFALLGTYYGGDGKSTFGLPGMQGSAPMHTGYSQGLGLSVHSLGDVGGTQYVTLIESEIPAHTHSLRANSADGDLNAPLPERTIARSGGGPAYSAGPNPIGQMGPQTLAIAGGSVPHNNMQPYLTMHFNICLQGVFPQRP